MKNKIFAAVFLSLFISVFAAVPGFCGKLEFRHVGGWGTGSYVEASAKGNYVYCAAEANGVDVFDISAPSRIRKVRKYDIKGWVVDTAIKGNYLYPVTNFDGHGLEIIDISNPLAPKRVGTCKVEAMDIVHTLAVAGDYAYLGCDLEINNPN